MTCAMEVTQLIPFPSLMPLNGSMADNLHNRYFSLFGSYPRSYCGNSMTSEVCKQPSEEMVDENFSNENDENGLYNINPSSTATSKYHLTELEERLLNYSNFPSSSTSLYASSYVLSKTENYYSFTPLYENLKENCLLKEQQQMDIKFEKNKASNTNFYNEIHKAWKNCSKTGKFQNISKLNNFPLTSKYCHNRLPAPGWDEKLIQRIESHRSIKHIQERILSFKKHYKKGFRYRTKQRAPLRVQLLKYKCLNSIYGDLECILDIIKTIG